jgi:hypothetical protein
VEILVQNTIWLHRCCPSAWACPPFSCWAALSWTRNRFPTCSPGKAT